MRRLALTVWLFMSFPLLAEAAVPRTIADLGLKLVYIEPGTFTMGSLESEAGRRSNEVSHQVTLTKGFWLGQTEVTQGQWTAVMGYNPSRKKGDTLPVEQVSWEDAMMFCMVLTKREQAANRLPEGYAYTLPTEAQWEYACRAGTTGAYAGDLDAMAWYGKNGEYHTHAVNTKRPNAWGLSDMQGNVGEWCLDWYVDRLPGGTVIDPSVASPVSRVSFRVIRGGGFRTEAARCRSAERSNQSPDARSEARGFRLALSSVL